MGKFTLTDFVGMESIDYGGRMYRVNLSYDVVLRAYQLLEDDMFNDIDKYVILFQMFFGDDRLLEILSVDDVSTMVGMVFDQFINSKDENRSSNKKPVYDLHQDAEYIYASFMQDYGIDLLEEQGRMHWYKFMALLGGLSSNTKLHEVIEIRVRPVPKPTKHNQEERKQLLELKRVYALKVKPSEDAIKHADEALSMFSKQIKAEAMKKI